MGAPALRVSGLGKRYRLGLTHAGSLSEAANRWTRRLRGLPPVAAPVDAAPGAAPADRKGDFWALKDVDFEVRPGEVVGIIGRNGAGKSTLLKILSRVTSPTTGEVRVRGRVGSLLEVGTGFHPELTGRENVYMNATLLGMTRREVRAKLDEIVAFAGVEKFLDTPVKRYSSGMQVRLGFAVAAHLEPEVLIVDEVLSVGDAEFQKKCLGKMKDVAGEGRTVLFVSHNMGAVRQLCGRCVLLQKGRLELDADPDDALRKYEGLHGTAGSFVRAPEPGRPVFLKSASGRVLCRGGREALAVSMVVCSAVRRRVSVDLRLSDALGAPVGLFGIGTCNRDDEVELAPPATFVEATCDLNGLANGLYRLSVDLAEPMHGYFDRVDLALEFVLDKPPDRGNYRRLSQGWGFGSHVGQLIDVSSRRGAAL